jgi:predicted RNA-binding Zn ribbon-like protein
MNPSALVALANLQRPRRGDTEPRTPLTDLRRVSQALADDGVPVGHLTQDALPAVARLADAVSELADCIALRRPRPGRAVGVVNELASGSTATMHLEITDAAVQSSTAWCDRDPAAGLARRVIQELGSTDLSRLLQCQRKECDLLFFDATRSRTQRWHAENPCGWLERQRRRRTTS